MSSDRPGCVRDTRSDACRSCSAWLAAIDPAARRSARRTPAATADGSAGRAQGRPARRRYGGAQHRARRRRAEAAGLLRSRRCRPASRRRRRRGPPASADAGAAAGPPGRRCAAPPRRRAAAACASPTRTSRSRGNHLLLGNFNGFNAYDIENPAAPKLLVSVVCPGGQGDVSVYGNLLFMSVEQTRGRLDCGTRACRRRSAPSGSAACASSTSPT